MEKKEEKSAEKPEEKEAPVKKKSFLDKDAMYSRGEMFFASGFTGILGGVIGYFIGKSKGEKNAKAQYDEELERMRFNRKHKGEKKKKEKEEEEEDDEMFEL